MPDPAAIASFRFLLREHRLAAGLTQDALAERAGLSERTIQDLERGISRPRRETVRRLIAVLRLPVEIQTVFEQAISAPRRGTRDRDELPPDKDGPDRPVDLHDDVAVASRVAEEIGWLPAPLTSFVGRQRELADLKDLLANHRLVTLTGIGGVGKTRLAVEAARAVRSTFADGNWFVDLAGVSEPALLPQALATTLHIHERRRQPLLTTIAEALATRSILLVIDNCEHLLDGSAALVDQLLGSCPGLRIIATSRERLGVAGEIVWQVPSLSVPEDEADLWASTEAIGREAVELFAERARLVEPRFALTDRSSACVMDICRRVDGIPLAIELAAAWLSTLTLTQIADRLDDQLALLTRGSRTAAPRHRTLRATLNWSYDLLPEACRVLLGRLAVFVGGWSLEAAEAVCAGGSINHERVLDLLASLVDASLVIAADDGGVARYHLLTPVRQFALECLRRAGEEAEVSARHADWCRTLAERAEPYLRTSQELPWLDRLVIERDNLRAALSWCETNAPEIGLRLAASLWRSWQVRSSYHEDRRWLERLLAASPTPTIWHARVLHGAGCLAREQGLLAEARERLEASIDLGRALGDRELVGRSLADLGPVLARIGDPRSAQARLEEALALLRESGDMRSLGPTLVSLGSRALERGHYPEARALLDEGVAVLRRVGDRWRIAFGLSMLGHLAAEQGRWDAADAALTEGLAVATVLGSPGVEAVVRWRQGFLAWRQGRLTEASEHLESALALERSLQDHYAIAGILVGLAQTALARGNLAAADGLLRDSLALQESTGSRHFWGRASCALGETAWRRGDPARAVTALRSGLVAHRERDDRLGIAECLEGLATVAVGTGQPGRASHLLGAAGALRAQVGAPVPPVRAPSLDSAAATVASMLDPTVFAAAWTAGSAMSSEQAVRYALDESGEETGMTVVGT